VNIQIIRNPVNRVAWGRTSEDGLSLQKFQVCARTKSAIANMWQLSKRSLTEVAYRPRLSAIDGVALKMYDRTEADTSNMLV